MTIAVRAGAGENSQLSRSDFFIIAILPFLLLIPCVLIGWYVTAYPPASGKSGGYDYLYRWAHSARAIPEVVGLFAVLMACWQKDVIFLFRYYRALLPKRATDVKPISQIRSVRQ